MNEHDTWQDRIDSLHGLEIAHLATMCEAIPVDPATLPDRAQRILIWLAKWDDHTAEGVAELFAAAASTRGST